MRQRGFTLIELMVAIFVLAILAVYSVPAYRTTTIKSKMTTMVNDYVADLHFAKTEAIKRSKNIVMCAANADFTGCSGDRNWGAGWLILDEDETDADAKIIKVMEIDIQDYWLAEPVVSGASATGTEGRIVFTRYGFAANSARTVAVCGPERINHRVKGVILQNSGRIRLAVDTNDDGYVDGETSSGASMPMVCSS